MNKTLRGFTLIELLVVISIVAGLTSVVLPRLSSARDRAVDSYVKVNFSGLTAQAEISREAIGNFGAVCSDPKVIELLDGASDKVNSNTTSDVCYDDLAEWAASTPLKRQNQVSGASGIDYWCVDRSGQTVLLDDQIAVDALTCT
jgi:prepilin-type N-terminal cleavage/methylation domain-containing protein